MYKVSIPVLELALKNQEREFSWLKEQDDTSWNKRKKRLASLKKSIKQLKEILGK